MNPEILALAQKLMNPKKNDSKRVAKYSKEYFDQINNLSIKDKNSPNKR